MLDRNKVTKANDLNLRAYQLTRIEQLFVLSVISLIEPNDENFKTYKIRIKEFIDLLKLEGQSKYYDLPKITKGLMSKVIEIKNPHSLLQVCWFSSVEHKIGKGIIEVEFSPKLLPYLIDLKENFVTYALKQVAILSSKYSIRIYELLKQYSYKKIFEISLPEFRILIGIEEGSYPLYNNLKERVLKTAQKELNKKSDISFKFEEIKTGRKVTALKFVINANEKPLDEVCASSEGKPAFENKNESTELINELKGIFKANCFTGNNLLNHGRDFLFFCIYMFINKGIWKAM